MNRSLVQNIIEEKANEISFNFNKGRIEELNTSKPQFPLCWLNPFTTESEILSSGIITITLNCDIAFLSLAEKGFDKDKNTDNSRVLFLDDKVNEFLVKMVGNIGDRDNVELINIRTTEYPSYNVSGNVTSAILLSFSIKSNLTVDYCG